MSDIVSYDQHGAVARLAEAEVALVVAGRVHGLERPAGLAVGRAPERYLRAVDQRVAARDAGGGALERARVARRDQPARAAERLHAADVVGVCLLYTSDAADE